MKCIDVKENSNALLDGEAGILQAGEMEKHLESCISCRTEYKNQQTIKGTLRQSLAVIASATLDEMVMQAFKTFHGSKKSQKAVEEKRRAKNSWFDIPRFAYYPAALFLFSMIAVSAFQFGRMSESENITAMQQSLENNTCKNNHPAENLLPKIIEVPVVLEKIVRVPVITEKIVKKIVYVVKENKSDVFDKNNFALKNSIENNGYLTRANLADFQPVSEFKIRINKEGNENEK